MVPSPVSPSDPSPTSTVQDVMAFEPGVPLEPRTYFIDPDGDPSTPLRVLYEVPGALAIIRAHQALEDLTMERDLAHHKPLMEQRWADAAALYRKADAAEPLRGEDLDGWAFVLQCLGRPSDASTESLRGSENYPLIIPAKPAIPPETDQPQAEARASRNPGKNILGSCSPPCRL